MARRRTSTDATPPVVESPRRGLVQYKTDRGWGQGNLDDVCDDLVLSDLLASRVPAVYEGQRNMPGWYHSQTMDQHLQYDSFLERSVLISLDLDRDVLGIAVQPFRLWLSDQAYCHPDILVERCDGSRSVIEVTKRERLAAKAELRLKFDHEVEIYRSVGWSFEVVTDHDLDPQEVLNRQWFASFRRPWLFDADIANRLLEICVEPTAIYQVLRQFDLAEVDIRPVLFHMVARGQLAVDLSQPITNLTEVWTTPAQSSTTEPTRGTA
jgi:hypothetical protein